MARYEEGKEGMVEEGLDASWTAPPAFAHTHSLTRLLEVCDTLREHHPDLAILALLLLPAQVGDYAEWQRWLRGAALQCPPGLRFIVVDDLLSPATEPLAAAEPVIETDSAQIAAPNPKAIAPASSAPRFTTRLGD